MKQRIYLFILFAIALLSSCKTVEKGIEKDDSSLSTEKISLTTMNIQTANFSNISASINLGGNNISSRASMRIICDSIIQISIQPIFGIEMGRLEFTPSGFLLLNKMKNIYFSGSYDLLLSHFNLAVGYRDLESMLLNRPFLLGENKVISEASLKQYFKLSSFPDGLLLTSKSSSSKIATEFIFNKESKLTTSNILHPYARLQCQYSDFSKKDKIIFPFKYSIGVQENRFRSGAEINISSVEFNKQIKLNKTDLSNCKQVESIEELLQ